MTPVTIHLVPSRLKQRLQVVNDAFPGIILLFTGLETFLDLGLTHRVMPYISVIVGVVVLRSALTELKRGETKTRVKWFDISSGAVILIEAMNKYKPYKGFQPAYLLILVGVATILRGVFTEKIPKLRRIVLSDEQMFVRTSPFRSFTLRWDDLVRIDRSASMLEFVLKKGTTKLRLRQAANRAEVMEQILEIARDRGISIAEPE